VLAVATDRGTEFLRKDERRRLALPDLAERLHPLVDDRTLAHRLGGVRAQHRRDGDPLRLEDHRAAALRAGLPFHRALDLPAGRDLADLDGLDADPPLVGRFVEFPPDAGVDLLAPVERVVGFHVADHPRKVVRARFETARW